MKKILFMLIPALLLFLAFRPITAHIVKGKVTDDMGNIVANATVAVKGTKLSTLTDAKGEFTVSVADKNSTLVISSVGYTSEEVKLAGRQFVTVKLKSAPQLEEVVITTGITRNEERKMKSVSGTAPAMAYRQYNQGRGIVRVDHGAYDDFNTGDYAPVAEKGFLSPRQNPLSTFSIDVDAASYSNVRRYLNGNALPPAGAVRIEEMVNYFTYNYPQLVAGKPFSINAEIGNAPWNTDHKLVLIGLQGKKIPVDNLPASNLVFLIDVSGSMNSDNKLPLVKMSMKLLVDQLRKQDRVSIVVYAGAAGLVLKPTSGDRKTAIKEAIGNLQAGGSTAGGAGIRLAYKTAKEQFMKDGNNRVILCTDGDFNVGESSDDAMERLIEQERKSGVFLTVLGYGMGNYKDNKMQILADKGNGNHAYIDGLSEAKKVLVNEFGGTLFTIAKDVKLQVEFNPGKVQAYRLIGYENRMLASEDFNDDKKDAGELGSGHTVTALYEIIPVGVKSSFVKSVDALKYQDNPKTPAISNTDELLTVKFRYKAPDGDDSRLLSYTLIDVKDMNTDSENLSFAGAVAEFGMLLRNSEYRSKASFTNVLARARNAKGIDHEGYRAEFIRLVETAMLLAKNTPVATDEEGTK